MDLAAAKEEHHVASLYVRKDGGCQPFSLVGGGGGGIEPPPGAVIGLTVCFRKHTSPLPALDSSPDTPQAPLQKPGISKR